MKTPLSLLILCTAINICVSIPSVAEQNSYATGLSLEDFRALALHHSPVVAEIDRLYADELARAFENEVPSNPELQLDQTYTRMNLGGANDSQTSASLAQPIRLSQFGAKQRVSELIRKLGDTQRGKAIFELNQKLRTLYYSAVFNQESLVALTQAASLAQNRMQQVRVGVKKGLLTSGEQYLFEGEHARLLAAIQQAIVIAEQSRREIVNTIGLPCSAKLTSLTVPSLPSVETLLAQSAQSPFGFQTRAQLFTTYTEKQRALAESNALPIISPRIVYQHTNDGGDFIGAGITIPLPLWDRNQAGVMRAEAAQRIASSNRAMIDNGTNQEQISSLHRSTSAIDQQITLYREKVIPSFNKALANQEHSYEQGRGDIFQIWQTFKALQEAKYTLLKLSFEAMQFREHLAVLVGEEV